MIDLLQQPKNRTWLMLVGSFTLAIGAAYSLAQQSTRLSANDLPLTTSQTIYHELNSGAAPADVVPAVKTDLGSDSTLFAVITDKDQHVLASSAQLNGQTPLPPIGAFAYTAAYGSDRFTWQPASGVRMATRMLPYGDKTSGGFIITGQSLSSTEDRINTYGLIALVGWLGVIAWTSLILYWPAQQKKSKSNK